MKAIGMMDLHIVTNTGVKPCRNGHINHHGCVSCPSHLPPVCVNVIKSSGIACAKLSSGFFSYID